MWWSVPFVRLGANTEAAVADVRDSASRKLQSFKTPIELSHSSVHLIMRVAGERLEAVENAESDGYRLKTRIFRPTSQSDRSYAGYSRQPTQTGLQLSTSGKAVTNG